MTQSQSATMHTASDRSGEARRARQSDRQTRKGLCPFQMRVSVRCRFHGPQPPSRKYASAYQIWIAGSVVVITAVSTLSWAVLVFTRIASTGILAVRNRRARFAAREKKADRLSPGVSIIV